MATGSDFGASARGRRKQTIEGGISDSDDDVFGEVDKDHVQWSRWKLSRGVWRLRHEPGPSIQRSSGFQETDRRSSWREGPRRESDSAIRWSQARIDRGPSSEPVPRGRGYSHRASAYPSDSHSSEGGNADDSTWRQTRSAVERTQNEHTEGIRDSQSAGEVNKTDVRQPGDMAPLSKMEVIGAGKKLLLNDDAEYGPGADSKSWRRTSQGGSRDAEGSGRVTRDFFRRPGIRKQAASARAVDDIEGFEEACGLAHGDPSQERSDSDSEVAHSTEAVDTRSKGWRAGFQLHPMSQGTSALVPLKSHDIKRTARVLAFSEQDLRHLLNDPTPSDVLMELSKRKDQFRSLLDGYELPDETLLLIVRVVSRLTDLDQKVRYLRELNTVFSMIESSLFISKHLTRYIVSSSTKHSAECRDKSSVVQSLSADFSTMLRFFQLILESKPSACSEVGVALILLQKEVTSASMNNESFDLKGSRCLMTEVEQVSEICSSLSESRRMAKKRSFEKSPPNNFRDIPIFPKSKELRETGQPFLRKNIIRGKYDNVEHYLDVQFRLLREDFVAPLREGVTEFLSNSMRRLRDIRIYYNVVIVDTAMVRHQLVHKLSFPWIRKRPAPEHWESSKRLLYGSFVCLTTDNFKHIYCATVADRNVNDLSNGLVNVRFLTPPSRTTQGPFIMAESSAYFEAYRHVLLGLQEIKEQNLPFKKYIVDASSKVDFPSYLRDGDVYDMRSLVVGTNESCNYDMTTNILVKSAYVHILELESWPLAEDLHLDESQKSALQTAITNEFTIIQGPPGTGKTYVGLKIVELLLYNAPWMYNHTEDENPSPILVVCYTNHALDQFLEGIIAFGEENVVRVGGQSSSQILETKNLSVVRRNMPHDKGEYRERMNCLEELEVEFSKLEEEIQRLILKQQLLKGAIMNVVALTDYIKPTHYKELLRADEELGEKRASESDENNKESVKKSSKNLLKWLNVELSVKEKKRTSHEGGSKANEPSDRIDVDVEGDMIQRERQVDDTTDWEVPQTKIETIFIENAAHDMKCTIDTPSLEELQQKGTMADQETDKVESIWVLKPRDRWRLYRSWVKIFKEVLETTLAEKREKYQKLSDEIDGLRAQENLKALRESSVVGMTTSGAARHRSLLKLLGPRVVVVEEAAEVLEAHIITTLTSKCQHLILIGDHQQLKPNPTVYRLAKMFNLDTSLFERMIYNSMPCQSLMHQHRMRPEISLLMRKHFYSKIEDDESVLGRDDIKGVQRNLFFITHEQLEDAVDDNKTRSNQYEAEVLVALCKYLLQQGYRPSQITILTTYTGQLFCFRRLMDKTTFEGVRVCVVDNFQGEENDIILLSLVRSNAEGSIGFLRTSNRVCVALSRAKLGLYCIGNATILKKAQIWHDIMGTLEAKNQIGASLPLVCQTHPTAKTQVATAEDFKQKAPCGGCDRTCDFRLPCGHVCRQFCHTFDQEHKEYKCMKSCERLCERGHPPENPCSLKCHEPCNPCGVEVSKVMPKCGHEIQFSCYKYDTITCPKPCQTQFKECHHDCPKECGQPCPEICPEKCGRTLSCDHSCTEPCSSPCTSDCSVEIEKRFPKCGHSVFVECSKNVEEIECTTLVQKTRSKCGHEITVPCSVDLDSIETRTTKTWPSRSRTNHRKFKLCEEIVEKTYPSCGHVINLPCHQDVTLVPCSSTCEKLLTCGHPCPNECGRPCSGESTSRLSFRLKKCTVLVKKTFPKCGHSQELKCWKDVTYVSCHKPCMNEFPCGHDCTLKCGEPCICEQMVLKTMTKCHHSQWLPCRQNVESYKCKEKCRRLLACGHKCSFKCWEPCPVESSDLTEDKEALSGSRHSCFTNQYSTTRKCVKRVTKEFPDCGHSVQLKCYEDITTTICPEQCNRVLACGHVCPNKCGEPCPGIKPTPKAKRLLSLGLFAFFHKECTEHVQKELSCGHEDSVACSRADSDITCYETCTGILDCGHGCRGRCFSCKNGTQHMECMERCKNQLLCGHDCLEICGSLCSTSHDCMLKDWHSRPPANPDKPDPCKHNIWNRQLESYACIIPCRQKRRCEHPCVGVCGEPCPPFCRVCDKHIVSEKFSTKYIRPKDTFIYLVDCGHLCETRFLDKMMSKFRATLESGCVEVRSVLCPKCKEPILHCPRYEDLLKMIKSSVDAAKRKCKKASVSSRRVGFEGFLQEDSEKFSFAVGRWMRCPEGHVFYVKENKNKRQKPLCPDCRIANSRDDCAEVDDDSVVVEYIFVSTSTSTFL